MQIVCFKLEWDALSYRRDVSYHLQANKPDRDWAIHILLIGMF